MKIFRKLSKFFYNSKPCEKKPKHKEVHFTLRIVKDSSDLDNDTNIQTDSGSSQEPLVKLSHFNAKVSATSSKDFVDEKLTKTETFGSKKLSKNLEDTINETEFDLQMTSR